MATVSMFPAQQGPSPKREAERLKTLAESLREGGKSRGNEMVSGLVVKQSPLEHLARGLQTAGAGYFEGQSRLKDQEDEQMMQQRLGEALNTWGENPQAAAAILAQDPRTSDMAMKLMMGETDHQRQKERWGQQDALQRELAQMRVSSGGGNMPAPMKIANEMFELEQVMNNPNAPESERFMAERQYNLLGQAAKTYGFDRGFQTGEVPGYDQIFSAQNPVPAVPMSPDMLNQQMPQIPTQPPQAPAQFQDILTQPLPPQDMNDPMARNMMAVQSQQQQIGVSPAQRPDMVAPQVSAIPGYGETMAQMAAQKKAAEGRAAEVGKRQGENENLYRSTVARMPQLEDTVTKLSKLGQAATFNNAGLVRDFAARELNMDIPDAAIARAEYISVVDNEILPLLRDTFGAQFTQKEGESLKATLGAPNVSPQEKDAVLRSFIATKMQSIESMRREMSYGDTIPTYKTKGVNIGGQDYNPQQKPQIAVNPQTGERLINRGNGWEPYNGQ